MYKIYKVCICIFFITILCGCSTHEKTESIICTGTISEVGIAQTIEAKGNIVKKTTENNIITPDQMGLTNDQITEEFLDQIVLDNYGDYLNVDGINVSRWFDGSSIVISVEVDLENGDKNAFQQLGIIPSAANEIALDKTVDGAESQGFKCQ